MSNEIGIERRTVALAPAPSEAPAGRTLSGYAARWGEINRIRERDGRVFDEVVVEGAFTRGLEENLPAILFDHGQSARFGRLPVARLVEVREDAEGLWFAAELFDNELTAPLLDALRAGALEGVRIGFAVEDEVWDRTRPVPLRQLVALDLIEISVVLRGAYAGAKAGLRSGGRRAELQRQRADLIDRLERAEVAEAIRADRRRMVAARIRPEFEQRRAEEARRRRQERRRVALRIRGRYRQ